MFLEALGEILKSKPHPFEQVWGIGESPWTYIFWGGLGGLLVSPRNFKSRPDGTLHCHWPRGCPHLSRGLARARDQGLATNGDHPAVVGRPSCEKQEVLVVLPGGPRDRSQGSGASVVSRRVATGDLAGDGSGSKDGAPVCEGGPAGWMPGG